MLLLGILCAVWASCLYNTPIALQALQVRGVHHKHSLRVSLIGKLVRNRRWLGATALGWPVGRWRSWRCCLAPLTVVQPCLASGLVVLLWLGVKRLGETPGTCEYLAVAAIVAGVAWAAPDRTTDHADTWAIALALGLVAIPIAMPYLLRRRAVAAGMIAVIGAGCGYAWTAVASKLLTFLAGEQVVQRPALVAEIVAAGHRVELYCHRHRNQLRLGARALLADAERAKGAIEEAGGQEVLDYRPPYGIFSAVGLRAIRSQGWRPVLWSLWGRDWTGGRRRARSRVAQPPAPGPGTCCCCTMPTSTARATPGSAPSRRCR